jgi:hypothetical protein
MVGPVVGVDRPNALRNQEQGVELDVPSARAGEPNARDVFSQLDGLERSLDQQRIQKGARRLEKARWRRGAKGSTQGNQMHAVEHD